MFFSYRILTNVSNLGCKVTKKKLIFVCAESNVYLCLCKLCYKFLNDSDIQEFDCISLAFVCFGRVAG